MIRQPANWQQVTDAFTANNNIVAPAAGAVIVDSGALPGGVYRIDVTGTYGGTPDVIDNMKLVVNGRTRMTLPVIPVANATAIWVSIPGVVVYEGQHVQVQAVAAGAVGSVYRGTIICTPIQTTHL